jgi:hypothetical protein
MISRFEQPAVENTDKQEVELERSTIVKTDIGIERFGKYISGAEQTVTYYKLINRKQDTNITLDPNLPATEQQYLKFNNAVIRVTTPLEVSRLSETVGEAILPPEINPMVGDYFTLTLLDGSIGLFRVKSFKTVSYNVTKRFTIEYELDTTSHNDPARLTLIENKVVKNYHYLADSDTTIGSKILIDDDYRYEIWLDEIIDYLGKQYIERFKDESSFLTTIVNNERVYDGHIDLLFHNLISYNTDLNHRYPESPLVDYILIPDIDYLKRITLNTIHTQGHISHSRIEYRIKERLPARINRLVVTSNDGIPLELSSERDDIPSIENLFKLDTNTDKFSIMFKQYLNGEELDNKLFFDLANSFKNSEDPIDYWLIPFIILFAKYNKINNNSDIPNIG